MGRSEADIRAGVATLLLFHPEAIGETTSRKPTTVLVTGSRDWTDENLISQALSMWLIPGDILIHGAAPGADTICASKATAMGITCRAFPARWKVEGKAAGPIRNRKMLDQKPELVLAFHDDLPNSKGTKDCIEEANRRGLTVFVHEHGKNGELKYYVLRGG